MSVLNAQKFLKEAASSPELRSELNGLQTNEIFPYLQSQDLGFSAAEFNESVNVMHANCKTHLEAEDLMQTVYWFKILTEDFSQW